MLAAQVNARKHENLRMILGFEWIGGLFFCDGLLCWVVVAAAAAGRGFGRCWTEYPSPPFACWPELWVPLASCSDRWSDGCSPRCNRVWCLCWTSVHDVRVCRGRFGDLSLRLRKGRLSAEIPSAGLGKFLLPSSDEDASAPMGCGPAELALGCRIPIWTCVTTSITCSATE